MRLIPLQEQRPGLYARLVLSGKLYEHLAEIGQTSRQRMAQIILQMSQADGVEHRSYSVIG